jgi:ankyrin repeat protein
MELKENKIKKCLKSYLCGKKHLEIDNDKALAYFKQSSRLISELKANNINNLLLNETEVECDKLITSTLESSIDVIDTKNIITNDDNDIFNTIETGKNNDLIKYKKQDFYKINSDGLTALHFAIKCGDSSVLKYAFKNGVDIDIPENTNGHTLFEFACLERDPNIIKFLQDNGADIHKHKAFRNNIKYYNKIKQIDNSLILKIILTGKKKSDNKKLDFIYKYIPESTLIGLDNITIKDFIYYLQAHATETYINIIKEELEYNLLEKITCPNSKLEIILYNLIPFIDYPFNLSLRWLLNIEIKYKILKILKYNKITKLEQQLVNDINDSYIKTKLFNKDFMNNILYYWTNKINV